MARNGYHEWRAGHSGKQRFTSKHQAWLAVMQIRLREKRADRSLHPYTCRWANDYRAGRTGAPHVHIGHDRKHRTIEQRLLYYWRKSAVWPYFRLRGRWRQRQKQKANGTRPVADAVRLRHRTPAKAAKGPAARPEKEYT